MLLIFSRKHQVHNKAWLLAELAYSSKR